GSPPARARRRDRREDRIGRRPTGAPLGWGIRRNGGKTAVFDRLSGGDRRTQQARPLGPAGGSRRAHALPESAAPTDLMRLDQTGVGELANVVERRARRQPDDLAELPCGGRRALEQNERLKADRMADGGEEEGLFEHAQEARPYGLRAS